MGTFKEEFTLSNFGLNFPKQDAFYKSQWRWPRQIFLIYRMLVAGYVTGWNIYSYVVLPKVGPHPSIVFLTQWTYLVLALHLVAALIVTIWGCAHEHSQGGALIGHKMESVRCDCAHGSQEYREHAQTSLMESEAATEASSPDRATEDVLITPKPDTPSISPSSQTIPWPLKATWLLFNMSAGNNPMISMVYFFVLYPYIKSQNPDYEPGILDINVHGINSVILILEFCFSAIPIRLLHAVYPIAFGLIYVIFSIIYWSLDSDNNALYPNVLDWNSPWVTIAILCVLTFLAMPFIQLFWYGIYKLRLWIFFKIYKEEY